MSLNMASYVVNSIKDIFCRKCKITNEGILSFGDDIYLVKIAIRSPDGSIQKCLYDNKKDKAVCKITNRSEDYDYDYYTILSSDNEITPEQSESFLKKIGYDIPADQIKNFISIADYDKDGNLSYDEIIYKYRY
jgi:hypothetical protein